ncbi:prepilin-type N-terminal cleavage/methylation domain-containing protein [Kiritimatiellaeota bacterium B1221]|nr:prepilin-type N-terminal cleavage/methylation domain-containing protein [Kiritimatiellaeota bacterium B1221]
MEHPPTYLNTRSRGFSLIELLIALSLVSVVMALAWIILDSTRQVADEIQTPIEPPLQPLWNQLEFEFDHHLPQPTNTKFPSLRFSEKTGLEMISLLPGPENVPLQTELHYWVDEEGLKKSIHISYPPTAQTNLITADVASLRVWARRGEEEILHYPLEQKTALPHIIKMELRSADGTSFTREWFLPSSLHASSTTFENEDPAE